MTNEVAEASASHDSQHAVGSPLERSVRPLLERLSEPWAEPAKSADDEVQKLYRLAQEAADAIEQLQQALGDMEYALWGAPSCQKLAVVRCRCKVCATQRAAALRPNRY